MLISGRLKRKGIFDTDVLFNSIACATAEFPQAEDTIFCKVLMLKAFLNGSLFNKRIMFSANCRKSLKPTIIPVSFVKTSFACGIGVEIIGQAQLMAYEKVPLTAWLGSIDVTDKYR